MKFTRIELRQLINEALKPFFMGVEPSSLLNRLRNDQSLDQQIKQLLNHPNPEIQRTGLELVASEPGMAEKYPELDSDEFYLDLDHIDRSAPVYKKEFEKAQQFAGDAMLRRQLKNMSDEEIYETVKELVETTFPGSKVENGDVHGQQPFPMLIMYGHGVENFNRSELKRFEKRLENLGFVNPFYIHQGNMVILELDVG